MYCRVGTNTPYDGLGRCGGKQDEDQHGTLKVGNEGNENQHDLHEGCTCKEHGAWRMGRSCQEEGAACLKNTTMPSGVQAMYMPVVGWLHSRDTLVARMGGAGRCRMFLGGSQTVWIGLGISRCGLSTWGTDERRWRKVNIGFRCTWMDTTEEDGSHHEIQMNLVEKVGSLVGTVFGRNGILCMCRG